MIRLIQFGKRVADFIITPTIVAQLPGWDEMIEKHREYKAEVCSVRWSRVEEALENPVRAREVMLDNWSELYSHHIMNDYDVATNKIIVVGPFSPLMLESRRLFLEKFRDKPEVYLYAQNLLWLHCLIHVRNGRRQFSNLVIL